MNSDRLGVTPGDEDFVGGGESRLHGVCGARKTSAVIAVKMVPLLWAAFDMKRPRSDSCTTVSAKLCRNSGLIVEETWSHPDRSSATATSSGHGTTLSWQFRGDMRDGGVERRKKDDF